MSLLLHRPRAVHRLFWRIEERRITDRIPPQRAFVERSSLSAQRVSPLACWSEGKKRWKYRAFPWQIDGTEKKPVHCVEECSFSHVWRFVCSLVCSGSIDFCVARRGSCCFLSWGMKRGAVHCPLSVSSVRPHRSCLPNVDVTHAKESWGLVRRCSFEARLWRNLEFTAFIILHILSVMNTLSFQSECA